MAIKPFGLFAPDSASFLNRNSDMLLGAGLGLLSGKTPQEQFGQAVANVSNERRLGMTNNKTIEYLKRTNPDLAMAVETGIVPASDAFKMAMESKTKKSPIQVNGKLVDPETYQVVADFSTPKQPSYDFKTLPDGTYGNYDQTSGQFTPIGQAPKQDDVSVREQNAQRLGLTPDSPGYQSYVLTGKMPREDAQPLTATDKKAILDADEMVLATQGAIPLIDRALELNDKAYSGPTAGIRGVIGGNLGIGGGQETMELDNVVTSQALGQLKAIFGAAPTEGERKILLDIQGSASQPPEVRKGIFERARAAAQRRLDFYQQRANELRGGDFYKQTGGTTGTANRTSSGVQWRVEP